MSRHFCWQKAGLVSWFSQLAVCHCHSLINLHFHLSWWSVIPSGAFGGANKGKVQTCLYYSLLTESLSYFFVTSRTTCVYCDHWYYWIGLISLQPPETFTIYNHQILAIKAWPTVFNQCTFRVKLFQLHWKWFKEHWHIWLTWSIP